MIYFDSAATTMQKPAAVAKAMSAAAASLASPGRSSHSAAADAAELAFNCRKFAADYFRVPSPENVVFTSNATHGLNIAINALSKRGRRTVISGYEHNSVYRPVTASGAEIAVARGALFDQASTLNAYNEALTPGTALCVVNHVSNAFGFILPIEKIAELCRERGIPLIIDASQSAGTIPLNFARLGAQFVAMPGHKGLYGPQGTGLLLCGDSQDVKPLLYGGSGSNSK
ncbi:MAG: aminotransferase class V-fold PLP-dependent enzyme, partial [Oscillospiraceae bacterium]|nr:aminotransferase class V-fold PLP-dependent enzyme [Oscillospiraceae bacterium]